MNTDVIILILECLSPLESTIYFTLLSKSLLIKTLNTGVWARLCKRIPFSYDAQEGHHGKEYLNSTVSAFQFEYYKICWNIQRTHFAVFLARKMRTLKDKVYVALPSPPRINTKIHKTMRMGFCDLLTKTICGADFSNRIIQKYAPMVERRVSDYFDERYTIQQNVAFQWEVLMANMTVDCENANCDSKYILRDREVTTKMFPGVALPNWCYKCLSNLCFGDLGAECIYCKKRFNFIKDSSSTLYYIQIENGGNLATLGLLCSTKCCWNYRVFEYSCNPNSDFREF